MEPGSLIRLAKLQVDSYRQAVLIKTESMEVVQLLIPESTHIPTYRAQGEVIVHCLEGSVQLMALGENRDLSAGELLYLLVNEPFSIKAIRDASLVVTMIARHRELVTETIGS